jgi:hypothetical protein
VLVVRHFDELIAARGKATVLFGLGLKPQDASTDWLQTSQRCYGRLTAHPEVGLATIAELSTSGLPTTC